MRFLGTTRVSLGALRLHGEPLGVPRLILTNPVPHLGKGLSWPAAHCPRQPNPHTNGQLKWEPPLAPGLAPLSLLSRHPQHRRASVVLPPGYPQPLEPLSALP